MNFSSADAATDFEGYEFTGCGVKLPRSSEMTILRQLSRLKKGSTDLVQKKYI
jgi:hypothetical protein